MKRTFGITVSAMILALQLGSPLAAAEPTLAQLNEIAGYLESDDVEALRAFVLLNPALLEGDTPLTVLLRRFMEESVDVANYIGFEPDLRDAIARETATDAPLVIEIPPIAEEPEAPVEPPEPEVPGEVAGPPDVSDPPILGEAPEAPVDAIY